jgi:DNA-binding HxlR family transcriptional regulator
MEPKRRPLLLLCLAGGCALNQIAFEGRRRSSVETAALVSDRWTLRILHECLLNVRRIETFQSRLRLRPAQLIERLDRLVSQGLLRRVSYQDAPPRYEYVLTERGFDLHRIVFSLLPLHGRRSRPARPYDRRAGHAPLDRGTIFDGMTVCPDCGEVLATQTRIRFDADAID